MIDQLVLRAQEGDIRAFEAIYEEHKDFVWKVLCRMIRSEADCQDVFQDVFVIAYQKIRHYRFNARFSTWLYTIAFRTALNHQQKQKRNQRLLWHWGQEQELRDEGKDEDGETQNIASLLQSLNPIQRACVVLKDMEGFSYEEIARMLEIPLGTVRSNLNRGRKALRKMWKVKGDERHVVSIG